MFHAGYLILGSLQDSDKNILPDKLLTSVGVEIKIGEVTSLNIKDKECSLADGKRIYFEKLIIATGSVPTKPKWLKGSDLENVFTIPKNKVYLDKMYSKLKELKRVITIGAGFIGV